MSIHSTETIRGDLAKARRDADDARQALQLMGLRMECGTYDDVQADVYEALEAMLRGLATLTLTVERLAGLP